ncbi:MAG: hypothetical protein ABI374_00095 [Ginsengibacter sp.]
MHSPLQKDDENYQLNFGMICLQNVSIMKKELGLMAKDCLY